MKTLELTTASNKRKSTFLDKARTTLQSISNEYVRAAYGYASIGIIVQSCMGSIAAMLLLMNAELSRGTQMIELTFVTVLCMAYNASVLAQLKGKLQFRILVLSIFTSLMIILLNLKIA